MVKKILIFLGITLLLAVAIIIIYRLQILKFSIETVIRNNLPPYVTIDKMSFDLKAGKALFKGFRVINPQGFSDKYLLVIDEITCRYKMRGRNILSGIEIFDPIFSRGSLQIERLADRRVNLSEMQKVMAEASSSKGGGGISPQKAWGEETAAKTGEGIKLSDIVKLPEAFRLKSGNMTFVDRALYSKPHIITFDNIDAGFTLKLDESYTRILGFSSEGAGNVNGNENEVVKWVISLNPTTPALTMSNRFEVSGVDIISFEPYYDKYSPFVFKRGTFSGVLVFDFDNGSIGSTNEVHLSDLSFYIKPGYENASFWQTSVPELAKYFTTPSGDIVFDFKIKGEMSNPQFYLGPISKQAIASMVIDKVATAVEEASQKGAGNSKVQGYVELFRALANKR